MITVKRAREIAQEAHKGQKDKLGDDYQIHLEGVRAIVKALGGDLQLEACALLHDAVEDTDLKPLKSKTDPLGYVPGKRVTYQVLFEEGASERQLIAIKAVTKKTGAVQSNYLNGIVEDGEDAQLLKLADLMHNMSPARRKRLEALKGDGVTNRLKKKYAPSIARLMTELGYLVTEADLAKIPVGSFTSTTTNWQSGDNYIFKQRKASWVMSGDEVEADEQLLGVGNAVFEAEPWEDPKTKEKHYLPEIWRVKTKKTKGIQATFIFYNDVEVEVQDTHNTTWSSRMYKAKTTTPAKPPGYVSPYTPPVTTPSKTGTGNVTTIYPTSTAPKRDKAPTAPPGAPVARSGSAQPVRSRPLPFDIAEADSQQQEDWTGLYGDWGF